MSVNHTQIIQTAYGKGLAAVTDLPAGSLILKIPSPFLTLVETASLNSVCSHCFVSSSPLHTVTLSKCPLCSIPSYCSSTCEQAARKEIHQYECRVYKRKLQITKCDFCGVMGEKFKNCMGCKVANYCSKECQEKGWKQGGHKKDCKILRAKQKDELESRIIPTAVRGAMRIIYGLGKGKDDWLNLVSHEKEIEKKDPEKWSNLNIAARGASAFAKGTPEKTDVALAALCRMEANAFRITSLDDAPIGMCFSPTLSLANHSCLPNAAVTFSGKSASLRALSAIKKGDEILISYIDNTQPVSMRQKSLRNTYFFTCTCAKCSSETSLLHFFESSKTWMHPQFLDKCSFDASVYQIFLQQTPVTISQLQDFPIFNLQDLSQFAKLKVKEEKNTEAYRGILEMKMKTITLEFEELDVESKKEHVHSKDERCEWLMDMLKMMQIFLDMERGAEYPIPVLVKENYLHHLSTSAPHSALPFLLFRIIHCDPYHYPSPYHPTRLSHLVTLALLYKHLSSLPPPQPSSPLPSSPLSLSSLTISPTTQPNNSHLNTSHILLSLLSILVPSGFGEETRMARLVEQELADVEVGQRAFGQGKLVDVLREWRKGGAEKGEARKMVRGVVKEMTEVAGSMVEMVEMWELERENSGKA